jgi:hypothetical protein
MKFAISLLAAFVLVVTGVPALRVNAQEISNSPSEWQLGTISASSVDQTGLEYFTVNNTSGYDVRITIRGTNMTGGSVNWTLSDTATPGADTYGLKAGLAGGSYNVTVNTTDTELIGNLTDGNSQKWGLYFLAPTEFSDGVEKSGNITLTATQL